MALASEHPAALRELRACFADLPMELLPLHEILGPNPKLVVEGATLEEKAKKRGDLACRATALVTLAEEVGLEVDALGGRPGVRSTCFAHEHATDAENNAALLEALAEVDPPARTARYRCCLALFDPWAPPSTPPPLVQGVCEGVIALGGRGVGQDYEPLFLVQGHGGLSFAELSDELRGQLGHRAQAARAMLPFLREHLRSRLGEVVALRHRTPSLLLGPELSDRASPLPKSPSSG
ncbi:MAG: non-canonical purine NTP pyrophosphatase [Myxococcales bacterium]|nr:non-canonical purine NTP pyrophosphatase [Polyangiaceae bacterium]MDW8248508.1 non-canonical purine NTP pyrophosphatase [Myxococcales bacterium]